MIGYIILILAAVFVIWQRGSMCAGIAKIIYMRGKSDVWKKCFELAERVGGMKFDDKILHAYLVLKDGDIDEANKKFALLSMDKLTDDQRLRLKSSYALVFWKRGDVATAIEMLEEVAEKAPATATYGSLGYMYAYNGNLTTALEFNLKAYEYNDSNAIIIDNLAYTYYKMGEYAKAREFYEKLIEMSPTFPEAYYGYGRLLVELGEVKKGLTFVRRALTANFSFLTMTGREEINEYLNQFDDEELYGGDDYADSGEIYDDFENLSDETDENTDSAQEE